MQRQGRKVACEKKRYYSRFWTVTMKRRDIRHSKRTTQHTHANGIRRACAGIKKRWLREMGAQTSGRMMDCHFANKGFWEHNKAHRLLGHAPTINRAHALTNNSEKDQWHSRLLAETCSASTNLKDSFVSLKLHCTQNQRSWQRGLMWTRSLEPQCRQP